MYINYLQDRKLFNYSVSRDGSCGIKLVFITNFTVLIIRNILINIKNTRIIIILYSALMVCDVEPV